MLFGICNDMTGHAHGSDMVCATSLQLTPLAAAAIRSEQRTWLLRSAVDTWNCFSNEFLQLWGGSGPRGDLFPSSLFSGQLLKVTIACY